MKNVTITEISGQDVDFDQEIDTETAIASGGGVAVTGDAEGAVFATGVNTGVIAAGDVTLDHAILGDDNNQLNDSTVGAFAENGSATNVQGENVNMGSGDLFDVDSEGDAQVTTGMFNTVTDADIDVDEAYGPLNVAVGEDISQNALEDNSVNLEDSFNTDLSLEDAFNTITEDSYNSLHSDDDTYDWHWDSPTDAHPAHDDLLDA